MAADTIGGGPPTWNAAPAVPINSALVWDPNAPQTIANPVPIWDTAAAVPVPGMGVPVFDITKADPIGWSGNDPAFTTLPAVPIGMTGPAFNPGSPGTIAPPERWDTRPPDYIPVGQPVTVTVKGGSEPVTIGGEPVTARI